MRRQVWQVGSVWALVFALAGCASLEPLVSSEPDENFSYVDIDRVDQAQYRNDFGACAKIANQVRSNNDHVVSGAMNTALDRASFGILGEARSKDGDRISVLKRCLTGRGYHVLR